MEIVTVHIFPIVMCILVKRIIEKKNCEAGLCFTHQLMIGWRQICKKGVEFTLTTLNDWRSL